MHANENGNMAKKKGFQIFTESQPINFSIYTSSYITIMDALDKLVT